MQAQLASQAVELPGIGRIIAAFLFVVMLAGVGTLLLRRFVPRGTALLPSGGANIAVVGRVALGPGSALHVVEVDGVRIAVVAGRYGVSLVALRPGA